MQEREISLKDMLFAALRGWRKIVVFAIICAILFGSFTAVTRVMDMNDPEMVEKWQEEYEVAYGSYWAAINDIDRQIAENERLASQAELEIERLDIKKADYEGNIKDLEAKIVYYEARIEDCEASTERLKLEKEKLEYYLEFRKKQNTNSLLMKIDPYNVNVYDVYLRIDSGYEILPGNTYQNQDPTPELIDTYRLLVTNTEFFQNMLKDLDINTTVSQLSEVVSVSKYGMNSIYIHIISDSADWAESVGEYITNAIYTAHSSVVLSIANHDLSEYNKNSYTTVSMDVYSRQHAYIQEELSYEASIREVDMSLLSIESDIRTIDTDIRHFRQDVEDTLLAISELPIVKKSLEDKIASYHDANFEFKSERIELLKEPEPQHQGFTTISVITGFVKFAIVGGVLGAALSAIYVTLMGMMRGKILSADQACCAINGKFFGYWPKAAKKRFAAIDRWIDDMSGRKTSDVAEDLVMSNIAVACEGMSSVVLCGGASKETIETIAGTMADQLPQIKVVCGASIDTDPAVVRGVAECDAVILVEEIDKSGLNAAIQINDQLKSINKSVLGVILN